MSCPESRAAATQPAADYPSSVPSLRVPGSRLSWVGEELRTVAMVWRREMTRFVRARSRVVTSLVQPVLFLFVLGAGLAPLVGTASGLNFTKFIFPGVVAISVVTSAIYSAVSIVWDREFGFLREMLVAPVSRASLVIGTAAGGASVAAIHGLIMLILAPAVGVRLTVLTVIQVIGISLLMAFAMTTFGVFVAAWSQKMESFQSVIQFLLLPMLFLSGALFPVHGLPVGLAIITRINPLTYTVNALRRVILSAQRLPATATAQYGSGIDLFGIVLPTWSELLITLGFAAVFLGAAVRAFGRTE